MKCSVAQLIHRRNELWHTGVCMYVVKTRELETIGAYRNAVNRAV